MDLFDCNYEIWLFPRFRLPPQILGSSGPHAAYICLKAQRVQYEYWFKTFNY